MSAEATLLNKLTPKYAAQPVKNLAAFERIATNDREEWVICRTDKAQLEA